jgi:hypothetical protein
MIERLNTQINNVIQINGKEKSDFKKKIEESDAKFKEIESDYLRLNNDYSKSVQEWVEK